MTQGTAPRDTIIEGDAMPVLCTLPDECVQSVVTSPPYWGLRDYGVPGQLGAEDSMDEYLANMVAVFHQVRRVLRRDGVLWLNMGDAYSRPGNKGIGGPSVKQPTNRGTITRPDRQKLPAPTKNLIGMPWRLALALQDDGWIIRSDVIWHKPNPMPEAVRDRPTRAHEYLFMLTREPQYLWDFFAMQELAVPRLRRGRSRKWDVAPKGVRGNAGDGFDSDTRGMGATRNVRSVWTISHGGGVSMAHFATFPDSLVEQCIRASTRDGDIVLDPFIGSGTVGVVAQRMHRHYLGIEINPRYAAMARARIEGAR